MGMLVKGLGADHVVLGHRRGVDRRAAMADRGRCAGSRSPRTCRRNTASRRSAPADGPVKTAIFGGNNAQALQHRAQAARCSELTNDRFAAMKAEYEKNGPEPSNLRYGYVVPSGTIDHTLFA